MRKSIQAFLLVSMMLLLACQVQAAIVIDAATVARTTGTPANGENITTASFTPPNNSLLLVLANADNTAGSDITLVVSDSQALSWVKIVQADRSTGTGQEGPSLAWYAKVTTGSSMTISLQRSSGTGGTNRIAFKTYIITGHDPIEPIGAVNYGGTTTNNITPTVYTSTVDNSWGIGVWTDYFAAGIATSTDTEESASYAGAISAMSLYKAAATATAGSAVTMDFNAAGTGGVQSNWLGFEVRPAPPGTCSSPAGVTGQLQWITAESKVKYCDGSSWIDTSHATGASCTGSDPGTINYNAGNLSFCAGTNWISMKGSFDSSCSGTTAGTFAFTPNKYRYCDGTNWYQMRPSKIEWQQKAEYFISANTNSVSTGNFAKAVLEKSLILCAVSYLGNTQNVTSMTDSKGNSYAKAVGPQTGTAGLANARNEIWYAAGVAGGSSLDVTATFNSTFNNYKGIFCHEYSGAAMLNPIDQTSSAAGSTATASLGSLTTSSDNQLIFAFAAFAAAASNGIGFILRGSPSGDPIQDRIASTAGSYNVVFTNVAQDWLGTTVSVRAQ